MKMYKCPMHSDVMLEKPGRCPKCGMTLVEIEVNHDIGHDHSMHEHHHMMKPLDQMTFWEKFKMGMTMTMGMDHTGKTGREMAKLMEEVSSTQSPRQSFLSLL